jgi:hypothetical protein
MSVGVLCTDSRFQPSINYLVTLLRESTTVSAGGKKKRRVLLLRRPIIAVCNDL